MNSNGYKGMLRDRCPRTIDIALKWCKAKNNWVDHVYSSFIRIFCDNKCRNEAVRAVLGISSKNRSFNFHDTIDWDNLTDEDAEYWKYVEEWVVWFQKSYMGLENSYSISLSVGKYNYESFKRNHNLDDELAKYIISTFKI